MTRRPALWAGAAALIAAAPAAAFDDQWAQQVKSYMDAAAKPFFDRGYRYGGFSHSGSLNDKTRERLTVRLGAGRYRVAACNLGGATTAAVAYTLTRS